ncbi:hypothetical protein [Pseudonocardia sichuanensis]
MALEFRYGWCTLRLASGPHEVSIKATTMHDAFADLLDAVNGMAGGRVCQSVLWGGEGRGVFLDLTLAHRVEVGLVVHEMADPNWLRPGVHWVPERGAVAFATNCAFPQLMDVLATEVGRARRRYADRADHMEHWGWDFPVAQYEALLRNRALYSAG